MQSRRKARGRRDHKEVRKAMMSHGEKSACEAEGGRGEGGEEGGTARKQRKIPCLMEESPEKGLSCKQARSKKLHGRKPRVRNMNIMTRGRRVSRTRKLGRRVHEKCQLELCRRSKGNVRR